MIYRAVFGVAVMVSSVALLLAKPATNEDGAEKPLLERESVSLVKLTREHAWRLGAKVSKNELRILRVDEFDPEIISVRATSPTELHLIGLRDGWTVMRIAYDNGTHERVMTVVEKDGDLRRPVKPPVRPVKPSQID